MVCLPCIVIPAFLFIWHKFLQPIFLRFWNPFGKVEDNPDKEKEDNSADSSDTSALLDKSNGNATEVGGKGKSKTENGAASLHSKAD